MILAVAHDFYADMPRRICSAACSEGGVVVDVKSRWCRARRGAAATSRYWSL